MVVTVSFEVVVADVIGLVVGVVVGLVLAVVVGPGVVVTADLFKLIAG